MYAGGNGLSPRWYDRLLASFVFFTRLPLRRLRRPPVRAFDSVVVWWPLTGWLVNGTMAAVLYFGCMVLPCAVAVLLSVVARLLLTGAVHECELARFADAFGGGGSDRRRIIAIMESPATGPRGMAALIACELLLAATLCSMTPLTAALAIVAAGPFARMVAAQLAMMMPRVHSEATGMAHVDCRTTDWKAGVGLALQGLLPMVPFLWLTDADWQMVVFAPCLTMYFLYRMVWGRLRGYTPACCGAVSMVAELTVYVVACA